MPSKTKIIGGGPLRDPPVEGSFMVRGPQAACGRKGFLGAEGTGKHGHRGLARSRSSASLSWGFSESSASSVCTDEMVTLDSILGHIIGRIKGGMRRDDWA